MSEERPIRLTDLDPGIRDVVQALWNRGIQTTDSGDGKSKPAEGMVFDFEHVACVPAGQTLAEAAATVLEVILETRPGERWQVEATSISYTCFDPTKHVVFASKEPV